MRPLNKREYILDIATEAEPVDTNYSLWFRRVIWSLALKLDNELYVTMHYNQVEIYCSYKVFKVRKMLHFNCLKVRNMWLV